MVCSRFVPTGCCYIFLTNQYFDAACLASALKALSQNKDLNVGGGPVSVTGLFSVSPMVKRFDRLRGRNTSTRVAKKSNVC